ncbi:MAG: hypothetical protein WC523_03920 [Patescibacteria group bacterium]
MITAQQARELYNKNKNEEFDKKVDDLMTIIENEIRWQASQGIITFKRIDMKNYSIDVAKKVEENLLASGFKIKHASRDEYGKQCEFLIIMWDV